MSASQLAIAVPVARRPAWLGWATIVLGLLAALALLLGGQVVAQRAMVGSLERDVALFYVVLFLPLALLSLLLGGIDGTAVWRLGARPGRWSLLGVVAGALGLLACVALVWLHGSLRAAPPGAEPVARLLALGLAITVLQVLAEELLFRGWLLPALARRVALPLAVVLSAAAFAAFHLVGGVAHWFGLVNLMLGGIWFALLTLRSGGIVAPFAAHYGWNVVEDLGLGLLPNPGRGELGAIFDSDIVGSVWWGGSEEGLNPSLVMALVLAGLILPLLRRPGVPAPADPQLVD